MIRAPPNLIKTTSMSHHLSMEECIAISIALPLVSIEMGILDILGGFDVIDLIVTVILGIVTVVFSILVYRLRVRVERTGLAGFYSQLIREYQEEDFRESLEYVYEKIEKKYPPYKERTFDDMVSNHGVHARKIASYFDEMGVYITHGFIDPVPIISYMGKAIVYSYMRLEPYIEARRDRGDEYYMRHFEHLSKLAIKLDQDKLIAKRTNLRIRDRDKEVFKQDPYYKQKQRFVKKDD